VVDGRLGDRLGAGTSRLGRPFDARFPKLLELAEGAQRDVTGEGILRQGRRGCGGAGGTARGPVCGRVVLAAAAAGTVCRTGVGTARTAAAGRRAGAGTVAVSCACGSSRAGIRAQSPAS
jgi:hypothetical protein